MIEVEVQVGDFAEMVKRLNAETELEAQKWFHKKRRIRFPAVLGRMVYRFVKVYFFEGGCQSGFHGLMCAANSSLYQLMSYTKYWELTERERGRM